MLIDEVLMEDFDEIDSGDECENLYGHFYDTEMNKYIIHIPNKKNEDVLYFNEYDDIKYDKKVYYKNKFYKNINSYNKFQNFTPLKNSIRTADETSTKLPVTDLYGAPRRGADSNLYRYTEIVYQRYDNSKSDLVNVEENNTEEKNKYTKFNDYANNQKFIIANITIIITIIILTYQMWYVL
uniref:Uncharacterized protein n=1 Tax=viral metagenome TaxID=1070528 RepID=A0A6C0DKJ5_9ZZZZ